MLRDENDYDSYFEDTMKAGHYENRKESVDIMIRGSRDVINDLVGYGVDFKMDGDDFAYTREGAHSKPRILYHEDITGKEISEKLLGQVLKLENVTVLEYTSMQDILVENGKCIGLKAVSAEAKQNTSGSNGSRRKRKNSGRNPARRRASGRNLCGGIPSLQAAESAEDISIPPTIRTLPVMPWILRKNTMYVWNIWTMYRSTLTLYSKKPGRRFLISENPSAERVQCFITAKRTLCQRTASKRCGNKGNPGRDEKKEGTDHVWLSMENIDKDTILHHFPHIYERCLEEGYDVTKECIPVVPAQHYFMGGIWVDSDSKTSMDQLYAVGETSCNGVHGANRLASNSLLESLCVCKACRKSNLR